MTLLDHLKATGETVDGFAARIGEPISTIRKIAYRQRQPSLPLAVKIERATERAVTGADLVLVADGPAHCPTCDARAEHPSVRSCTCVDCPMRAREAA